jgi:Methylase of polypeptide chain release factors
MSLNLKHITKNDRQKVYPPSQDTFLLIDSIQSDLNFLQSLNPAFILEIGVGSGAVLGSLSSNSSLHSYFLGIDINPSAVALAHSTLTLNNCATFDLIITDVFQKLNLYEKVDVIICNPPYVITSPEEYEECQKRRDISSSFAGGEDGRQFISQLLKFAKDNLAANGVLYMLYEEHNGNFDGVKLSEQRRGCEGLAVIRMNKNQIINL